MRQRQTIEVMRRIFLSYARSDDAAFARRLFDSLADEFDVWFDRESMPSRALTFLQEIREAIDESDRLIVVIGPGAIASDYVRAEWQYALVGTRLHPRGPDRSGIQGGCARLRTRN